MSFIEILKVIFFGIVEGITEWLPISSTGHLILLNEFINLDTTKEFQDMFDILIQLGAILAVIVIYFKKLWPFSSKEKYFIDKDKFSLWFKIIVACIPTGILGLLLDDLADTYLKNYIVVSIALIFYGILFIIIENKNKNQIYKCNTTGEITYKMAFLIGLFQVLSIVPGTSRSGVTIIGAMLLGISRVPAAEFTFFLAIPVMFGRSFVKLIKFGNSFTSAEAITLLVGFFTAFIVSIIAIRFLMGYIKKNSFVVFGWYRIILGVLILLFFGCSSLFA